MFLRPLPKLAITLACCFALTASAASAKAAPAAHPLASLNIEARQIYAQARAEMIQAADPVLVVFSIDKLLLHHQGEQKTWPYVPPEVHGLKTVAHTALAAWTLLDRSSGNPSAWQGRAHDFAEAMRRSESLLGAYHFTPEQVARQVQVMRRIEQALQPGDCHPTQADVAAFAADLAPHVMANVSEAAILLLDALNAHTHAVKAHLGPAAFAKLRVVVLGSHMARDGELTAQYFQRLFGGESEGLRWVFSEGDFDDETAMRTLSIHLIDSAASTAFFGDAMRLHHDVLSEAVRAYLPSMALPEL